MSASHYWKEDDGDFLLVVSGSTRCAPFLLGWKEFKDFLRRLVKEQPGWVEVFSNQTQRRGEKQGWCRLRERQDADAVYRDFYRSKGLLVHVWETGRGYQGFRLMKCNCSSNFRGVPEGDHSESHCGIDIARVNQLGGNAKRSGAPAQTYASAQSMYQYAMYSQPQAYATVPVYTTHIPQPQVYSTGTNGMSVNVSSGAVLTEARGIFIRNLNYKVTGDDLYKLLRTVGSPLDYSLLKDSRTGNFKGAATARFQTKEEARYAAAYLDRRIHMGMELKVRMDAETTAVGRAEPMVVNGSNTYGYC